MTEFHGLPGGDLVSAGIRDLERGVTPALLVSIGAPRLRQLGLTLPRTEAQPEHRLYLLLHEESPGPSCGSSDGPRGARPASI